MSLKDSVSRKVKSSFIFGSFPLYFSTPVVLIKECSHHIESEKEFLTMLRSLPIRSFIYIAE